MQSFSEDNNKILEPVVTMSQLNNARQQKGSVGPYNPQPYFSQIVVCTTGTNLFTREI